MIITKPSSHTTLPLSPLPFFTQKPRVFIGFKEAHTRRFLCKKHKTTSIKFALKPSWTPNRIPLSQTFVKWKWKSRIPLKRIVVTEFTLILVVKCLWPWSEGSQHPHSLNPNHCPKTLYLPGTWKWLLYHGLKKSLNFKQYSNLWGNFPISEPISTIFLILLFNLNFIALWTSILSNNYKFCNVKGLTKTSTLFSVLKFLLWCNQSSTKNTLSLVWTSILRKIIWHFKAVWGLQDNRI